MDLLITTITWGLFIIGFFTLGKSFALQTLVSTIVYPIGVSFFSKFVSQDFLGGFFNISEGQYSGIAILLAVLFGAIITGTGCALAFLGGGSTGGVDVLAFIICKIFKNLKSSHVLFAINAITVALGAFVFKDLILALLGILNAFIEAMVIDKVFLGGNRAFIAQIISKAPDKISKDIIEKLERTTTEIPITGGYSKKDGTMLMVSFTMREYREIINIVNRHDKDAFVTIHSAHQINGEGWTR
jgi:uncharacterized membrane-anchored protein YitT (DUF2179 family)